MKPARFASFGLFALALLLQAGCLAPGGADNHGDPLSLWKDGAPAKTALLEYVAAATKTGSPDFIPPDERIAVFDFDGTLFCETAPTYFDWMLFEHRVLDDPDFRATDEQTDAAMSARATGAWPGLSAERERMMAEAWRGMTPETLAGYVRSFMAGPQPGFAGMRRGDAFYLPMAQTVRFLADNGFTVYVCSGTDRMVARPVVEDGLSLPPRQIIGSDSSLVAQKQDGRDGLDYEYGTGDTLILGGASIVKNLQMNKVAVIAREIGVHPVLAFGNSSSDASMLNYTLQNSRRRSMAFMLLCDDTRREYGNLSKARRMRSACADNGWIPVSMRDDWMTIYGQGVARDPSTLPSGAAMQRQNAPVGTDATLQDASCL